MSKDGWLPDGVGYADLPGNSPEDQEWERQVEAITDEEVIALHREAREGCLFYEVTCSETDDTIQCCDHLVVEVDASGTLIRGKGDCLDCPAVEELVETRWHIALGKEGDY